jgi:hypothetical protein
MMPRRPPTLADWLLQRLASGPRRHSLVGDLHEQFGRGRSAAWYWRQTVITILAGIASDLRHHPVESAHALCAGMGAWVLYSTLIVAPVWWLWSRIGLDYGWIWFGLPLAYIGGWVAGRTMHRFHPERLPTSLLLLVLAGTVTYLPRVFSLSVDAFAYPNYRAQTVWQVATLAVPIAGIIIGSLSGLRPSEQNFLISD